VNALALPRAPASCRLSLAVPSPDKARAASLSFWLRRVTRKVSQTPPMVLTEGAHSLQIAPPVVRAQQDRIRRVGMLTPFTDEDGIERDDVVAFTLDFRRLGWEEGQNFHLEYRAATRLGRPSEAPAAPRPKRASPGSTAPRQVYCNRVPDGREHDRNRRGRGLRRLCRDRPHARDQHVRGGANGIRCQLRQSLRSSFSGAVVENRSACRRKKAPTSENAPAHQTESRR
jgi:hypothetical protein